MCDHHLWDDPTSYKCVRVDEHTTHSYASTSAIPTQEKSDGGGSDD